MYYKIYGRLTNNPNVTQGARDFSLLDRDVIEAFLQVKDYRRFTKGIFTWVGFEKKCIEFDYVPRYAEKQMVFLSCFVMVVNQTIQSCL